MTDIATRIRDAHGPSQLSDADVARGWGDVLTRIDAHEPPVIARRHRRVSRRVLIAVVVAVISLASVALAQDRALREAIGLTEAERSAERMDVFDRPATGTRGMSPMMRSLIGGAVSRSGSRVRDIDPNDARHVMTYRSGKYVVEMWSVPTPAGAACLFSEIAGKGGGGGCSYGMKFNGHVTSGVWRDIRMGSILSGMADDDVRAVRVRLSDGRRVRAHLENNAFALRVADPSIRFRGLDVQLRDGRTIEVAMNGCLRSQMTRPLRSRLGCGYGMNRGPADVRLH